MFLCGRHNAWFVWFRTKLGLTTEFVINVVLGIPKLIAAFLFDITPRCTIDIVAAPFDGEYL